MQFVTKQSEESYDYVEVEVWTSSKRPGSATSYTGAPRKCPKYVRFGLYCGRGGCFVRQSNLLKTLVIKARHFEYNSLYGHYKHAF